MDILRRISTIALCVGVLYVDKGLCVGNCELAYADGTAISTSEWSFGLTLDSIYDTTASGTLLLNLTATDTSAISSVTNSSTSGLLFATPALENNIFTLTLADHFASYEEYETSESFKVTVTFTCSRDTRSLEIYQPIIDTNNHYPEFQNTPYEYILPMPFPSNFPLQLFGSISARDIDLTNTNISFTLNSADPNSNGFTASWLSQDADDTKLHYAQLLTTKLLSFESNVTFNIYATDTGDPTLTSETTIKIIVDEENSAVVSPAFTYPLYVADISSLTAEEANGSLIKFDQGDITLSQGADSTVQFALTDNVGAYASNFELGISSDYTTITVTLVDASDKLMNETYIIVTLSATKPNATDGYTVIYISLPGLICTDNSTTTETTTVATEETTSTTENSTSNDGSTVLTTNTMSSADTTEITTAADTTEITTTTNTTEITTAEDTTGITTATDTTGNTTTTNTTEITTAADSTGTTTAADTTGTTTIAECVTVTTEECVCDCSSTTYASTLETETGTTSSTTAPTTIADTDTTASTGGITQPTTDATTTAPSSLTFSKTIYRFEKDSTFIGTLMTETVTATNANGIIVYSTAIDNEHLNERVLIDSTTAQLDVTATIDPGVYTFQIVAKIEELDLSATAIVVLIISSTTECSGETIFGYALQIIELEEESAHEDVVTLGENDCNYTIYSQTPNQDWFYIYDNTLNSEIIDRESPFFSDMTVAQVRVIIDMTCSNSSTSSSSSTRSKRDTEYEIITGNIPYVSTRMIVVAIITDINDNAPIWSSETPSAIGFPGYDLAQLIDVPYAYNFTAYDADIDDNAVITYSLSSSGETYFHIHPTTGSFYTKKGVYPTDMVNFTINASDGVWTTSVNVMVRVLESWHVAIYYVDGAVLEDVDSLIREFKNTTGYWMRYLTTAVVSESEASSSSSDRALRSISRRSTRSTDTDTLLRVLLYGIYNYEPVGSETLVELADDMEIEWTVIETTTLDAVTALKSTTNSTVAYLAAIIVLSILLLLVLIAVPTIYYIYFRTRKETSEKSQLAYREFQNENGDSPQAEKIRKRSTLQLNDADSHTTTSSTESRRKSVAFKDVVEEIEDIRL